MSCNTGDCETRSSSGSGLGFSSSSFKLLGWLLSACLFLTLSEGVNGVSLGLGEKTVEGGSNGNNDKSMEVVGLTSLPGRVKRSRDVQQLCGYRLLDALRSVCDRNFVGFARRSDPTFLIHAGGEEQSGEDGPMFGNDFGFNPWEGVEYPSFVGGSAGESTTSTPIGNYNGDGGSGLLDYWELLQQPSAQSSPSASPIWLRNGGSRGGSGSTKAFALKMLAEPPKTHQRFRRNIIDECCKKPCAMGQMLKYCAITGVGKRGGN